MNNDTFQWTGDFHNVPLGLYEIFWKSGGSSLAAIGCLYSGERWIAPVNWTSKDCPTGKISEQCNSIERLVLIKSPTAVQPKKERIEVKDIGIESILIKFEGRRLSVGKIEQLKAAIEKIVNDD